MHSYVCFLLNSCDLRTEIFHLAVSFRTQHVDLQNNLVCHSFGANDIASKSGRASTSLRRNSGANDTAKLFTQDVELGSFCLVFKGFVQTKA